MRTNLATVLDPSRRSNDAREFETALRRKIVGQDAAIEKVAEIYQMFLAGLNAPGRPWAICSFWADRLGQDAGGRSGSGVAIRRRQGLHQNRLRRVSTFARDCEN